MNQGITIGTWYGGQEPCERLIKSLWNIEYPVLVVVNAIKETPPEWLQRLYALTGEQRWHLWGNDFDGYEIGAIEATLEHTNWDEFIFLQESIEVKDQSLFKKLFDEYPNQSVAYNPHFQMYLGKFRREILNNLKLPLVRDKIEAVRQEELFTRDYWNADPTTQVFNPNFKDENFYHNWEEMWGRKNLKLEDDYIIKRKGTWDAKQLV